MKTFIRVAILFALAAAPCAAQTTEQDLIKIENDWSQASVNRDMTALQRFYADDYISTDADGVVTTKAQELKNLTTGAFRLTAYKFDDLKVRVYGETAVVTGRNTIKGVWQDINRDVSGPYRFTDVFVRRSGQWQAVASQSSRITGR